MQLIKLTTQENWTGIGYRNPKVWGKGVEHRAPGGPPCSGHVLHAYPAGPRPEVGALVALAINPYHAAIANPKVWSAEGDVTGTDGLKVWGTRLKTIDVLDMSNVDLYLLVRFAVTLAKKWTDVEYYEEWHEKADAYLEGGETTSAEAIHRARAPEGGLAWYASAAAINYTRSLLYTKTCPSSVKTMEENVTHNVAKVMELAASSMRNINIFASAEETLDRFRRERVAVPA